MIGVLRPVKNELPVEFRNYIENVHCSGCVFVKDNANRFLSALYIYETDFLMYLLMGFNNLKFEKSKVLCTGFPIIKKSIYSVDKEYSKIVFAFSVVVAYAFLDDKKRDNNSKKAKLFIKLLEPHLESSLELLNIEDSLILHPKHLNEINEEKAETLDDLCLFYRPLISNLYFNSLKKLNINCNDVLLRQITDRISDILIYTDSVSDYYQDIKEKQFNLIKTESELNLAFEKVKSLSSELSILVSQTVNPWKQILTNILTYGLINYINKNWKKDDKGRSN